MNKKLGYAVILAVALVAGGARAAEVSQTIPNPLTTTYTVGSGDWLQPNHASWTLDINSGGNLDIANPTWETALQQNAAGTSTVNIAAGGAMTFTNAVGNAARFFIGNRPDAVAYVNVNGGTFNGIGLTDIAIGREGATGYLNISAGTVILGSQPVLGSDFGGTTGTGIINFTTDSTGTLTITGVDQAYYEGIFTDGTLTRGGTTYGTFAENFTVVGSELTAIAGDIPALPPYWKEDPVSTGSGITGRAYADTLAGKAADHNGDTITFSKASGPAWLVVAGDGSLSGSPTVSGTNTFTVTATDIDGATNATLNIFVTDPSAPIWNSDPVAGAAAVADFSYTGTLAGQVTDPEGDAITFSKEAGGPAWLLVSTNGVLSGTPTGTDLGLNTFTVTATDVDGSTSAELQIPVDVGVGAIGFNFTANWDNTTIQGKGTVDGFDQWTDSVTNSAGTGASPANSTNANAVTTPINASMVTVAWSSANLWNAGDESNPEQGLYKMYLDDGGDGPSVTVSGLTAWLADVGATGYKIDIYRNTDSSNFAVLSIYDGTTTSDPLLETIAAAAGVGDGSYPTGTGGSGARSKQSAVGTFTADTITFHSARNGGDRASISGFKITATTAGGPADAVTDLVISAPILGGTAVELSWTGEELKPYRVETNSNLIISEGWNTFEGGLTGNGSLMSVTNTIGPDQTFYRVISE